jgi:hypothetical protein
MFQNQSKLRAMIEEFPFLAGILNMEMLPEKGPNADTPDFLSINVERADVDLMCRSGYAAGVRDECFEAHSRGEFAGLVGRRAEYLYAVGADDEVVNSLSWLNCPLDEGANLAPQCGRDIFVTDETRDSEGSLLDLELDFNRACCLVWVTVETIHQSVGNGDRASSRLGDCLRRHFTVTIYKRPEVGFEQLYLQSMNDEFMRLDDNMLKSERAQHDHKVARVLGRLDELVHLFDEEVLRQGLMWTALGEAIMGTSISSVSMMAGRGSVVLIEQDCHLSLSVINHPPQVTQVGGTIGQIRSLVKKIAVCWHEVEGARLNFRTMAVPTETSE